MQNGADQLQPADIPLLHPAHCCCGSVACTFFRETQAAFDLLDDSLRTALDMRLFDHLAAEDGCSKGRARLAAACEAEPGLVGADAYCI